MLGILLNILALVSVTYAFENASAITAHEGKDVLFSFRYKSEFPAPFSLGIGTRPAFYTEGQFVRKHLSKNQLHRFEVNAWHSETPNDHDNTMIHFKINKVHRTDGGTYYCKYGSLERIQAVALNVHFAPGKVECQIYPSNEKKWELLQCSAAGGSPRGRIVCLDSRNVEIPVTEDVGENGTHIIQEILIKPNTSVYCCAINDVSPKPHGCHQFVLQREHFNGINEKATSKPAQSKTNGFTLVTTFWSLSPSENETTFAFNLWNYISAAALAVAFIGLATTICLCFVCRRHIGTFLRHSKENDLKVESTANDPPSERKPPTTEYESDL